MQFTLLFFMQGSLVLASIIVSKEATTEGEVARNHHMTDICFNLLWANHPYPSKPCDENSFPNQCAIRMGVALEKSSIDTSSFDSMYPNRRCYSGFKHSPRHILAAQELANWMKSKKNIFGNAGIYQKVSSKDFINIKGIVFIKNGWGSTDHIDLWNGVAMKGGFPVYFSLGQEIWFWELTK